MLLIPCPYCGKRPEIEFTHGGEAHLKRAAAPAEVDDQAWADYLYMRANTKGVYAERWRHAHGCGRFFNALRDTTTDHFLATYKAGEPRPAFPEAALPGATSGVGAVPVAKPIAGASAVLGATSVPGADAWPGKAAPGALEAPGGAAGTPR